MAKHFFFFAKRMNTQFLILIMHIECNQIYCGKYLLEWYLLSDWIQYSRRIWRSIFGGQFNIKDILTRLVPTVSVHFKGNCICLISSCAGINVTSSSWIIYLYPARNDYARYAINTVPTICTHLTSTYLMWKWNSAKRAVKRIWSKHMIHQVCTAVGSLFVYLIFVWPSDWKLPFEVGHFYAFVQIGTTCFVSRIKETPSVLFLLFTLSF